ncbi:MAG: hypothetical protein HYU36_11150 [Planctomycetes bacterium]|nr:hypothetical protein [Planctomycetota bacterium]
MAKIRTCKAAEGQPANRSKSKKACKFGGPIAYGKFVANLIVSAGCLLMVGFVLWFVSVCVLIWRSPLSGSELRAQFLGESENHPDRIRTSFFGPRSEVDDFDVDDENDFEGGETHRALEWMNEPDE